MIISIIVIIIILFSKFIDKVSNFYYFTNYYLFPRRVVYSVIQVPNQSDFITKEYH